MKIKTLDDAIEREHLKYRRLEARLALKEQLKMEAYDDSPIDNQWVAEKEAEIPGLITGLNPNHNYTITPNEENKQIIMESLPPSNVLKGGLVVAALMIIFKVLSVIRNNSAFSNGSGGGGNGRGTATGTKQQLEKLSEVGRESKQKVEEVKRLAVVFKPDHFADDGTLARSLSNLSDDISPKPTDERSGEIDVAKCVETIKQFDLASVRKMIENLPLMVFIKNENISNEAIEELNQATDFIIDIVGGVGGGTLQKLFDRLRDENENIIAAKDVGSIEKALGMYNEIQQKFSTLRLTEVEPNTPFNEAAEKIKEGVKVLTSPMSSIEGKTSFDLYTIDEALESIKNQQDDLSKAVVFGSCIALAKFNTEFDTKLEPNIKLDKDGVQTIANAITTNEKIQKSASFDKDAPELKERKEKALHDVDLLSKSILEKILKPLSEFRVRSDRVNAFIDKLTKKFEDISTSADRVISASKDDPL